MSTTLIVGLVGLLFVGLLWVILILVLQIKGLHDDNVRRIARDRIALNAIKELQSTLDKQKRLLE